MPLRDYLGQPVAQKRPRKRILDRRIIIAATVLTILISLIAFLYYFGRPIPTNADTLCPTKTAPSRLTVILLDVSDQFSEPQRLQVRNHLARIIRNDIPRFGLVVLYAVDRIGRRLTEPIFYLCNPGTGADLNSLYQNPDHARKKWQGFAAKLDSEINRQMSLPSAGNSPIFEAIQATALHTFGKPEYDKVPKHLVIISDLIQNTAALSMYNGLPSFDSFKSSPYFAQVRTDLRDVSVTVYYLVRGTVATQGRGHINFWEAYFHSQGATVESVDSLYGDK